MMNHPYLPAELIEYDDEHYVLESLYLTLKAENDELNKIAEDHLHLVILCSGVVSGTNNLDNLRKYVLQAINAIPPTGGDMPIPDSTPDLAANETGLYQTHEERLELIERRKKKLDNAPDLTSNNKQKRDLLMRDICEMLPEDTNHELAVCVNYDHLYRIVSEHLCVDSTTEEQSK